MNINYNKKKIWFEVNMLGFFDTKICLLEIVVDPVHFDPFLFLGELQSPPPTVSAKT